MAALLNPKELALLRGWMNHLGWPLLGQLYLDGAGIAATRQAVLALCRRLAWRARHCRMPELAAFWSGERKGGADWLAQAEAGLGLLLASPCPVPALSDPLAQWLEPRPVRKLQAAGLDSVGDLAGLRRQRGRLWWQAVPGLGARSARQAEDFLRSHANVLGLSTNALATASSVPSGPPHHPVFADLFATRPELDGSAGSNRAGHGRCRIDAADDYMAIQAWLALRDPDGHTFRSYRKEAERFLLWAVAERGKPLSSLDTLDCKAYRDFLFAPPERWTSPDFKPRWSQHWRPFKGPSGHRTVKHVETILSSLCEWLARQRYLDANPFDGLPPLNSHESHRLQAEHALDEAQWRWLVGYCERCEADPPAGREVRHYRRLWIALQLAYCTGLRLAELAAARFGDIVHKSRGGGQHWLRVLGKGSKLREVPLPAELVAELRAYARERGTPWGVPDSPAPLVGKFRKTVADDGLSPDFVETPFTASGLHTVLKGFFNEAATARKEAASGDPEQDARDARDADALARATTHWLRHTHATHALGKGADLLQVKENLGHASLSTTSAYLHGDKDRRHAAMAALFRKRGDVG